jgi:hypothetical protein
MKKISLLLFSMMLMLSFLSVSASAKERVSGYHKKNGTYVQPHYRSSPNSSKLDNWSSSGNYNPYTGKKGTRRY